MPIDPETLLDLAQSLRDSAVPDRLQQARFRTAVNRGYYACLVLAIQKIETANPPAKARETATHSWVKDALRESKRNPLLKIRHRLSGLEEYRNDADYKHDSRDFDSVEVGDFLGKAADLFRVIQAEPNWAGLHNL